MAKSLGGSISVRDLKGLLNASYKEKPTVGDWVLDSSISGPTAKVYHNPKNGKVAVLHRGTPATDAKDWLNNLTYAVKGTKGYMKTKRFLDSKKIQDLAEAKYGTKKMITAGHSRGSLITELLGKNGHETITLNKATRPLSNVRGEHQYDIRSSADVVSALNPFQKKTGREITIPRKSLNPLAEHSIDILDRLNPEQEIGRPDEPEGAGLMDTFKKGINTFMNIVPIRSDFSTSDKAFLATYGNWNIKTLTIIRTPVSAYITKFLNALSLGELEATKQRIGYDQLFHLAMIGTLQAPNDYTPNMQFITERNDTVRVRAFEKSDVGGNTEQMNIPVPDGSSITLNKMFDVAIRNAGSKFWAYDPFSNNCQDFLIQLLTKSNLLTPEVSTFIKQKLMTIAQTLDKKNPYTTSIARGLIGVSARLRALTGKGLEDDSDVGGALPQLENTYYQIIDNHTHKAGEERRLMDELDVKIILKPSRHGTISIEAIINGQVRGYITTLFEHESTTLTIQYVTTEKIKDGTKYQYASQMMKLCIEYIKTTYTLDKVELQYVASNVSGIISYVKGLGANGFFPNFTDEDKEEFKVYKETNNVTLAEAIHRVLRDRTRPRGKSYVVFTKESKDKPYAREILGAGRSFITYK